MLARHCFAQRKIASHFLSQNVQYRNFHVMNSSRLGMSLSTNPNVTHDTNKHRNVPVQRSVLLFGSMRAMSAAAVTSSIPTELPSIPTQPLASVPDASVLADIAPIPDAPVATVTEQIILATAGEPSFASLGLGGWTPVGWVQEGLEWLHISCGLPWWGAIIATTIVLRTLVFPLVIITQRNAGKLQNAMPKVQALQMKITEARQMGDAMGTARYTQDLVMLMKKEDVNPLRQMAMPLVQAPIFLSYFIGVRQMVNAPVESLQTGGLWWFTDLTMADPYFILPLVTCSTMALTIQLGIDGMNVNSSNSHIAKYALRAMPVVLFPFIMNFPTAMVVYWSATNLVSLIQAGILKIPRVRDYFKLPKLVKHDKSALPISSKTFVAGVKDTWSNLKLSRELEGRRQLDEVNFERAGTGPLVKTYKFDPTRAKPAVKKVA